MNLLNKYGTKINVITIGNYPNGNTLGSLYLLKNSHSDVYLKQYPTRTVCVRIRRHIVS